MSNYCQCADRDVLVRFWSIDQPQRASVIWPVSEWPKLVFAAVGTLIVKADDQIAVLPPNRALWVLPGCRHEMSCRSAVSVRTLYFRPELAPPAVPRPIHVRPLLRELIVETCRVGPLLATDPDHACLVALLRNEVSSAPSAPVGLVIPNGEIAAQAARLVVHAPAQYGNVPTLLAAIGCSRRTLERRFREETGMSLGRWIQEARLILSVQFLASRPTLLDVAIEAGYASASAYGYAFRRHFGVAPAEWNRSV
ncbi:MAG: AraC family transcriptional regulator [Fimbriimonadaceae bacterium]